MANTSSDKAVSGISSKGGNSDSNSITGRTSEDSKNISTMSQNDSKDDKQDKLKRFENEGVVFKAKLIGSELVMEPRGDKMCQSSIQRLKAIIKGTNSHKRRIILKISYEGVKVFDEKTNEMLHHHEVPQISYIASDDTDTRTFGYVCDIPNKAHQFICFKTSGPAMNVMSVISALFDAVLEKKNSESELNKTKEKEIIKPMESIDLVGDSGIMDADLSFSSDLNRLQQAPNRSSSVLADSILSSHGFVDNNFSNAAWSGNDQKNQLQGNQSKQQQQLNKQPSNADLLFADLFSGFSDPIIVDKNDSLVSSKLPLDTSGGSNSDQMGGHNIGIGGGSNSSGVTQRTDMGLMSQVFEPPPASGHHQSYHHSIASTIRARPSASFQAPIPARSTDVRQSNLNRMGANSTMSQFSLPKQHPMMPEPPRHNRSLVYNHSSMSLSDAALTRQFSFNSPPSQTDNYVDRYSVFNDIDNLPSIFESTPSSNTVNNNNTNNSINMVRGDFQRSGNNMIMTGNDRGSTVTPRTGFGAHNVNIMTGSQSFGNNMGPSSNMIMMPGGNTNSTRGNINNNNNSTNTNMNVQSNQGQSMMFRQKNPFDHDFFN